MTGYAAGNGLSMPMSPGSEFDRVGKEHVSHQAEKKQNQVRHANVHGTSQALNNAYITSKHELATIPRTDSTGSAYMNPYDDIDSLEVAITWLQTLISHLAPNAGR